MTDHAKRMLMEARKWIHDAEVLAQTGRALSDSVSLLRVLGFEILLKCAIHLSGQRPKPSHDYPKLWLALPGHTRKEIMETAEERMPGHTDFSDLSKLLKAYQVVWEQGRYFFELYEDYTLQEQRELGDFWEELGAPTEEADIQFYPNELTCLIFALDSFIAASLQKTT